MVQERQWGFRPCPCQRAGRWGREGRAGQMSVISIVTPNGIFEIWPRMTFGELVLALLLIALLTLVAGRWLYDATVDRWTW